MKTWLIIVSVVAVLLAASVGVAFWMLNDTKAELNNMQAELTDIKAELTKIKAELDETKEDSASTYTLSVSVSPSGAGSVSPSGGEYESGVQVTLTANPASGYAFDYWSGAASGTASTITITMDSNKNLTANFKTISPPSEEVIKITAEQLVAEYEENQVRADLNYKGKILEVSGEIGHIGKVLFSDDPSVSLTAGFLSSVVCLFDSSWQSQVAQLEIGQYVTIQGTCRGEEFVSTVYLEDCRLR